MEVPQILILILILLLWLLLLYLLLRSKRKSEGDQAASAPGPPRGNDNSRSEGASEAESKKKIAKVQVIIRGDPTIAKHLLKRAGIDHGVLNLDADPDLVKKIASQVPEKILDMLHIAGTQRDISFNFNKVEERIPVSYPTNDIEPLPMNGLEQLADILPEHQILSDDQFYLGLAENTLQVLQSYETITHQKQFIILEDYSGSMDEPMAIQIPRYVWAHGITISLALQALRGEATFGWRAFDGEPHPLVKVLTATDAERLMDRVMRSGTTDGGTNIMRALKQGVQDIQEFHAESVGSDILLISDGEDNSVNNAETIQKLLGENIRLHVAMIGAESKILRQVATTYLVFA